MQLAFSTLSCPAWTLDQIVRAGVEYGYAGVELRGIGANVDLRAVPELEPGRRSAVRTRFADSGLALCCLGSSARFADPAERDQSRKEARDYIELAADLGCPLVRVFGGWIPEGTTRTDAARAVAEELNGLAPFARQHGVQIVLETHDAFSTGAEVAAVLEQTERDAVGALWDLYHPYRQDESPEETHRLLRPYVRHVHVKDGRAGVYCLLGEGETPIAEMLRTLLTPPKDGEATVHPLFVSVEWEKRWIDDLAEPEVVLPQYARVLRTFGSV
jgi:sugar phosphate isomerase/epimerase